jgi:hypothetical protein
MADERTPVCGTGAMIMTTKIRSTCGETCPSAALSTTNPIRIAPWHPNSHHQTHKSPALLPILIQFTPSQAKAYFPKTISIISSNFANVSQATSRFVTAKTEITIYTDTMGKTPKASPQLQH